MGVVLDTSVVIAAERQTLRLEDFLRFLGDEPVVLASITASELLHGCYRAADAGIRARRFAFVEGLLQVIPVLPSVSARRAGTPSCGRVSRREAE